MRTTDLESRWTASLPLLVVATDSQRFTILAANEALLAACSTTRDAIVGGALFDVFPDNPYDPASQNSRFVRASLARAAASHRDDVMPLLRYDLPRRRSVVTEFEERHWLVESRPLIDDAGGPVTRVVQTAEDFTTRVRSATLAREEVRCVVRVESEDDLPSFRAAVRESCDRCGFDVDPLVDLLVAASALARRIAECPGGATIGVAEVQSGSRAGVRLRFQDGWPPLAPLAKARTSSKRAAMSLGLRGARDLVDELDVASAPAGTMVTMTKWVCS